MLAKKFTSIMVYICTFYLVILPSIAESYSSKKYAPYIGYEHAYTSLYHWEEKIDTKYTPRLFIGTYPIQKNKYKIGAEIGYTLPVVYEYYDRYYNRNGDYERNKTDIVVQGADVYFTYYQKLANNFHWFLKPGIEYHHESVRRNHRGYHSILRYDSVFVTARVGAGYNLNKQLAINLVAGTRFYDFLQLDSRPMRLLFNINAAYSF